ncbi:MAG TPA: serine hydrolase [Candidatus Bipolaricaulota bacterium]|nr:serine hydrolase [Candidatus Bipolaricaulota bacterium]
MIEFVVSAILMINPIFSSIDRVAVDDFYNDLRLPRKIENDNRGVLPTSQNFILKDIDTGKFLYGKNKDQQTPIASLTKLMTALVFLRENPEVNWEAEVTMQQSDEIPGAYPHIYRGETVSLRDVFNTMLVSSDNHCAKALARVSGLSETEFVEKMNVFAGENNMPNTEFHDVIGLSKNNVSTAAEVARLFELALKNEDISAGLSLPAYNFKIKNSKKVRNVYSTDALFDSFLNSEKYGYKIIGGKTGYLPEAGGCLAILVEKDNHRLLSVVLGSNSSQARFQDTKALIDWGFLNYSWDNL